MQRSPPPGSSTTKTPTYLPPHEIMKTLCQTGSESFFKADMLKKLATDVNEHPDGKDFKIEDIKTAAKINLKLVDFYNNKDILRLCKFQALVRKIMHANQTAYTVETMIQANKLTNRKIHAKNSTNEEPELMESSTIRNNESDFSDKYSAKVGHESSKLRTALLNKTVELPGPTPSTNGVTQDWMASQFKNITTNFNQKFGGIEKSIDSINGHLKTLITSEDAVALVDEANLRTVREITEQIEEAEEAYDQKIITAVQDAVKDAVKLEIQSQISDGSLYELPLSEASTTRNLTENQILVMANMYTNKCAEYRTAVYNAKRSGILQFTLMTEIQGEGEDKVWSHEEVDGDDKFKLNFNNLRKIVQNTNFTNLDGNKARLSKKNNMVVKLKITGLNAYNTSEKVKKIMTTKDDMTGVAIAILPPSEHDIDSILISWKFRNIITKFENNRGGFYTINLKDGQENLSGGLYHKSCTRVNISNPRAIAGIYEPSIPALRNIAAGTHFASEGQVIKFPENFFKMPINPGRVNEHWIPTTEEDIATTAKFATGNQQPTANTFTEI